MPPFANSPLADQADRERFATELERNFSVIAPAGVGKTTAIVARVAALAQADAHNADPVLPRLAVVTYTRKAAEEMQARARARLLADGAGPEQLGRFSQAFFGTIHSLCLLVLKSYGHLVGLPSNLEQTTELEPLWRQYLRSTDTLLHHLPEHARAPFLRHGSLSAALELVLRLPADLPTPPPLPPAPVPDISGILNAEPSKNKKAQANIDAGQAFARRWLNALHNESGHLPLPKQTTGGKDFTAAYAEAFRPLCDWLGEATLVLARGVAEDFRSYRKAQGKLSFDDMVSWAAAVLDHPEAGQLLRRQRWCIILDEAQDTDPVQFHVLLSLAGGELAATVQSDAAATSRTETDQPDVPSTARTESIDKSAANTARPCLTANALPPQGRFCMVGDPQQAIYGDRADLATYRGVHQALIDNERGQALRFTVTMRCDRDIVAVANRVFPNLLKEESAESTTTQPSPKTEGSAASTPAPTVATGVPQQVPYVPLQPRPDAGPGRVSRLPLLLAEAEEDAFADEEDADEATEDAPKRTKKSDSDRLSANALARTIAAHTPADFGAADWSEIAILCVRNEPLGKLARALQNHGLPVQNHSRLDSRGDSPAYAWLAGLARIMAEPENAFETTGVLREVFGLSDGALYAYTVAAGYTHASRDRSANPYHPLSLSGGALAQSGPQTDVEIKAVGEALQLLRAVRAAVVRLPLREAVRTLSERLELPARLASLPTGTAEAYAAELENLSLQAAALQEQDYGWAEWADALEEGFEARMDSAEPRSGHIQLLSCHKSKGLQWPVVLLASLFRPVGYASDNFPKLLLPGHGAAPRVAFSTGHGHAATEALLKLKSLQELQRLAYVACTRARRQMIWADDSIFYDKTDGSFGDALGVTGGENAAVWHSLPEWQATGTAPEGAEPAPAFVATGTPLPLSDAAHARADWHIPFTSETEALKTNAPAFIKRVLPSSLAIHAPRTHARATTAEPRITATDSANDLDAAKDKAKHSNAPQSADSPQGHARNEPDGSRALPAFAELEEAAAATAGADYGNWWHKAMELAPWGSTTITWQQHSTAMLATCPDPQRGSAEWHTFTTSELYTRLNEPQMVVRCELPLLWSDTQSDTAYDGFIDLVARDTATNEWLLIDWKTDRLHTFADPAAELLRCYGPQLAAYRKALTAMFNAPVQARLYNTPTGKTSTLPPAPMP